MKCKACNVLLLEDELKLLGEDMELCVECLEDNDTENGMWTGSVDDHDYQFGDDLPTFEEYNENSDY
jgi:hypothetical protein|tara:strand:+ start:319 stop:519 length:201 start_codon:yes stop_codon:yes gene_type:complete